MSALYITGVLCPELLDRKQPRTVMSKLSALVSLALFFSSCSAAALQPSPVEVREATPVARAVEPSASAGGLQQKLFAKGKLYFGTCADPGTLNNNGEFGTLILLGVVLNDVPYSQREHNQEGLRPTHPRELYESKARRPFQRERV
jgi:hypothetical protein